MKNEMVKSGLLHTKRRIGSEGYTRRREMHEVSVVVPRNGGH